VSCKILQALEFSRQNSLFVPDLRALEADVIAGSITFHRLYMYDPDSIMFGDDSVHTNV
jgi:hypothetical protein